MQPGQIRLEHYELPDLLHMCFAGALVILPQLMVQSRSHLIAEQGLQQKAVSTCSQWRELSDEHMKSMAYEGREQGLAAEGLHLAAGKAGPSNNKHQRRTCTNCSAGLDTHVHLQVRLSGQGPATSKQHLLLKAQRMGLIPAVWMEYI